MVIYVALKKSCQAYWLSRKAGIPIVELPFTVSGTATAFFALFDETLKLG
jgi:hypothetical protein